MELLVATPPNGMDWTTILITLLTVLGGTGAFNIYKRYMDSRDKDKEANQADGKMFRKNLIARIEELESRERVNSDHILKLTEQNATLRAQVKLLQEQNEMLKNSTVIK